MYPYIHLLSTGDLFIFVSKSAEIFNVAENMIVTSLPDLTGDYRTYPNGGGSVLLPLSSANNWAPEVVVCGGGAYQDITSPTDPSCGSIQPLSPNPTWALESMPEGRGMVEGVLLPDGNVVCISQSTLSSLLSDSNCFPTTYQYMDSGQPFGSNGSHYIIKTCFVSQFMFPNIPNNGGADSGMTSRSG